MFYFHIQLAYCAYLYNTAEKLEQADNQLAHSRFGPLIAPPQRKKEVSYHLLFMHAILRVLVRELVYLLWGIFMFWPSGNLVLKFLRNFQLLYFYSRASRAYYLKYARLWYCISNLYLENPQAIIWYLTDSLGILWNVTLWWEKRFRKLHHLLNQIKILLSFLSFLFCNKQRLKYLDIWQKRLTVCMSTCLFKGEKGSLGCKCLLVKLF